MSRNGRRPKKVTYELKIVERCRKKFEIGEIAFHGKEIGGSLQTLPTVATSWRSDSSRLVWYIWISSRNFVRAAHFVNCKQHKLGDPQILCFLCV